MARARTVRVTARDSTRGKERGNLFSFLRRCRVEEKGRTSTFSATGRLIAASIERALERICRTVAEKKNESRDRATTVNLRLMDEALISRRPF